MMSQKWSANNQHYASSSWRNVILFNLEFRYAALLRGMLHRIVNKVSCSTKPKNPSEMSETQWPHTLHISLNLEKPDGPVLIDELRSVKGIHWVSWWSAKHQKSILPPKTPIRPDISGSLAEFQRFWPDISGPQARHVRPLSLIRLSSRVPEAIPGHAWPRAWTCSAYQP
jgi:hypothetical protein